MYKRQVLDALELGYKVYLIEDGCRGVNIYPDDSEKAVNEMKDRGAVIINSKDIWKKIKLFLKSSQVYLEFYQQLLLIVFSKFLWKLSYI